ncbi:MAG: TIGR04283 family arsenosugar biosynthesis glycosyltransferase [Desulfobacterales bacterium]
MTLAREQLIVFTRYPRAGHTKTRLIPALTPQGAAALQRLMTERLLDTMGHLAQVRPLAVEIRFTGADTESMRNWLGRDFRYADQGPGDLADRMTTAMAAAFNAGAQAAVIVGTDIPGITAAIIGRAFDLLQQKDVVFGPATDGGYYLVGLRRSARGRALPALFAGQPWSTGRVLALSLATAADLALAAALLETLEDVDRPEDLAVWERFAGPRITVVIPALNEAAGIGDTVRRAQNAHRVEVIVADGGSSDDTDGIAGRLGARVLSAEPPRARQMNAGAAAATGEILLFLHADTLLPAGYDGLVRAVLSRSGVAAGAFALCIDSARPSLRLMAQAATWRSRRLQAPYGDQALFFTAQMFQNAGGFPNLPIMEDFELVRRLKKKGRIVIVPVPVTTSARRWLSVGVLKTWLINQVGVTAYLLGVAPATIARFYNREKGVKSGGSRHL